jgi:preprotein translocase subunit Sss1
MATLQQKIVQKFLAKLAQSDHADQEKIKQLRAVLATSKKPKPDDLVRIFVLPAGGDINPT